MGSGGNTHTWGAADGKGIRESETGWVADSLKLFTFSYVYDRDGMYLLLAVLFIVLFLAVNFLGKRKPYR